MPVTPGADHRGEMLDLQQLATIMHVRRRRDSPPIRSAYSKAMVAVIGRFGQSDVRQDISRENESHGNIMSIMVAELRQEADLEILTIDSWRTGLPPLPRTYRRFES